MRREYRPFSLLQLQRLVDMDALDVGRPIDLTSLCNTGVYSVDTQKRQFGVNLVDEVIIPHTFDLIHYTHIVRVFCTFSINVKPY